VNLELELRRLLAITAPRPWVHEGNGRIATWVDGGHGDYLGAFEGSSNEIGFPGYLNEAELVVKAVNALPGLLDLLDRTEGERRSALDREWKLREYITQLEGTGGPDCTCDGQPTPTQHRYFCPWRTWRLEAEWRAHHKGEA
jgi:hypothetical protein